MGIELTPEQKEIMDRVNPNTGAAGEHLVLGELLRRGQEAYLAQGAKQKHWDIVVIRTDKSILRISVKSCAWPLRTAIQIYSEDSKDSEKHFDVLVIVLLNVEDPQSNPARYLIIPHANVGSLLCERDPKRKDSDTTIPIGKNFAEKRPALLACESKWEHITDQREPSKP
ncbi:MAG TPA: hypothetical protein VLQ93_01085 [Myxococcaceae bacterium]|nr:hypothetical protein [Myxococcaceae bacterium]